MFENTHYFIIAFLATLIGNFATRYIYTRTGFSDSSLNVRRASHSVPTPRMGGVIIVIATFLLCGFQGALDERFVCFLLPICIVGIMEDINRPIAPRTRLAVFTVVSVLLVLDNRLWDTDLFGFVTSHDSVSVFFYFCFSILCLVSAPNAFNLIDGMNGLSATVIIIASICVSALGVRIDMPQLYFLGMILVCCSVAFLVFNFPNARLFLGDCGAYICGTLIVFALLRAKQTNDDLSLWLISSTYLVAHH